MQCNLENLLVKVAKRDASVRDKFGTKKGPAIKSIVRYSVYNRPKEVYM